MEKTKQRTKTEIYTRVVGYLRPVDSMNSGSWTEAKYELNDSLGE